MSKKNKNSKQSKKSKTLYYALGIILVVAISAFLITSANKDSNQTEEKTIKIPVQELSSTAKFFEEEIDGVNVKFFAIKDANGEIKTAFDACDVCYNSKKGYTQDGEYMVCNNCGNRYHVSGLGTENKAGGGCWPSYLESVVNEENLEIKLSSLEKGKYKFT